MSEVFAWIPLYPDIAKIVFGVTVVAVLVLLERR